MQIWLDFKSWESIDVNTHVNTNMNISMNANVITSVNTKLHVSDYECKCKKKVYLELEIKYSAAE